MLSWVEAASTGKLRSWPTVWRMRLCGVCRSQMVPGSRLIILFSRVGHGSVNCFLKAWAGGSVRPSRIFFFFGPPPGDSRFTDAHLPVWGDHGKRFFYGIPGSDRRGFKVADDTRGPAFDPTSGERVITQATLKRVREYIAFRFPAMKDAPLIESRVCQYEQTPDSGLILDRHPLMDNVWLVGGGSGHGFKHGPAIGELMPDFIMGNRERDAVWRLERFKTH